MQADTPGEQRSDSGSRVPAELAEVVSAALNGMALLGRLYGDKSYANTVVKGPEELIASATR